MDSDISMSFIIIRTLSTAKIGNSCLRGCFELELNYTSTCVIVQLTKDKLLLYHINTLTKKNVTIDKILCELPTFYWLPKLHKNSLKCQFRNARSAFRNLHMDPLSVITV